MFWRGNIIFRIIRFTGGVHRLVLWITGRTRTKRVTSNLAFRMMDKAHKPNESELFAILYVYEIWPLALTKVRMFKYKGLKRMLIFNWTNRYVAGENHLRIEVHNLYSSTVIRINRWRKVTWSGHRNTHERKEKCRHNFSWETLKKNSVWKNYV
jgi:hypothetical protein